jgi:nicotinamide mononucleotide transporter
MDGPLTELVGGVLAALRATSLLEAAGVGTGLLYVVLAIRQDRRCWIAGAVSTACYLGVFYRAGLHLQTALQVYYLGVAAYGWRRWRASAGTFPAVTRWPWRWHAAALVLVLGVSAATAALDAGSPAATAYLDALTTWGGVFASWLVARKVLENWSWWFAIDVLVVLLCWRQHLYASAALYAAYLILVVIGWRAWWRAFKSPVAAPVGSPA